MDTYIASVRLPGGFVSRIEVNANTMYEARQMLEAQYGSCNVLGVAPKQH